MAKFLSALLILILVVPVSSAGCGDGCEEVKAELGQEVYLSAGESAEFPGEELKIKFLEVINDSRCPRGATCIWAGQASCLVEITYFKSLHRVTLTQPGLTAEPSGNSFRDYLIEFDLSPYPEIGKEIDKSDYRLRLVVVRMPLLAEGLLVKFDVSGEAYSVFVTNEDTIADILALQNGTSEAAIPSGRIVKGAVPYNQPWSWHIDSEDIHMVDVTMGLCDGLPSQVEAHIDYWVENVQRFCPWNARIVNIEDYR